MGKPKDPEEFFKEYEKQCAYYIEDVFNTLYNSLKDSVSKEIDNLAKELKHPEQVEEINPEIKGDDKTLQICIKYHNYVKEYIQKHIQKVDESITQCSDSIKRFCLINPWNEAVNTKPENIIKELSKIRKRLMTKLIFWDILFLVVILFIPFFPYLLGLITDCYTIDAYIITIGVFPFITFVLLSVILLILLIFIAIKSSIYRYRTIKIMDATILKLKLRITVTYDELRRDINEIL